MWGFLEHMLDEPGFQGVRHMASRGKSSGGGKYRSAISGRHATSKHGKASPNTTVKESK